MLLKLTNFNNKKYLQSQNEYIKQTTKKLNKISKILYLGNLCPIFILLLYRTYCQIIRKTIDKFALPVRCTGDDGEEGETNPFTIERRTTKVGSISARTGTVVPTIQARSCQHNNKNKYNATDTNALAAAPTLLPDC